MARTKNKAKKCTGGHAPRKAFGEKPAPLVPDNGAKWDVSAASEADPVRGNILFMKPTH